MKFTLSIDLGNEAMQTNEDVADTLHRIADKVQPPEFGMDGGPVLDRNGNTVGRFGFGDVLTTESVHLQFVEVVEVFEREDGIYVFADLDAAERFEQAVAAGRGLPEDESVESVTYRRETPINVGWAAERLIAAEREAS